MNRKIFLIASLTLVIWSGISWWKSLLIDEPKRQPTSEVDMSISDQKKEALHFRDELQNILKMGKAQSALTVHIKNSSNQQATAGEVLHLSATVETKKQIGQVVAKWHLPADVEIVSGSDQIEIGSLHPGQVQNLSLDVLVKSSENRQIHLEISYPDNGEKTGRTAQFNTVLQAEIEQRSRMQAQAAAISSEHKKLRIIQ